jgi:hypothetical protein
MKLRNGALKQHYSLEINSKNSVKSGSAQRTATFSQNTSR